MPHVPVSKMNPSKNLVLNVQILRAVAATLVVIVHSIDRSFASDPSWFSWGVSLQKIGVVGVDIFFVISGYIITRTGFVGRRRTAEDFLAQRFKRVVPLYFILSLPWMLVAIRSGEFSIQALISTVLFWPAAAGQAMALPFLTYGWTLNFEILFYSVATLVLLTSNRLGITLALVAYAGMWILRDTTGASAFRFLGNPMILEFLFGVAIALFADRVPKVVGIATLVFGIAAIAATVGIGYGEIWIGEAILDGSQSLKRVLIWGLPAAAIVLGAVTTPTWRLGFLLKPLVFLGTASYSLYLAHRLGLAALDGVLGKANIELGGLTFTILGIAVSLVTGVAAYWLVENPLLRLIGKKPSPTVAAPLDATAPA